MGHASAGGVGTLLVADVGRTKHHRLSVWRYPVVDVVRITHGHREDQGQITLDRADAVLLRDALSLFIDSCEVPTP